MKVSEILFEGPYLHDGDFTPQVKLDSFPSLDGLRRENKVLGMLERDGQEYHFWLNGKSNAKVTTAAEDDIGQPRQEVCCEIRFHRNSPGLPVKNELQINTVYTKPEYRNKNLAMALYVVLCRYGYTIVSDFEQYQGGKALWKKMALEADARKFKIRIWSDTASDWVKDSAGNPLSYNGQNIAEDEIWQDFDRHLEPTSLLVLSHE